VLETFESYRAEARRLDREAFEAQHPFPLLLVSAVADLDEETGTRTAASSVVDPSEVTPLAVAPVRKLPGANKLPDLITIGRASTNDLRLRAPGVPKYHAYLRQTEDGMLLTDAGSTNGTHVNGSPLTPKQDSILLQPGDELLQGDLSAIFHSAGSFHDYVGELDSRLGGDPV
jgi:FHA domain